MPANDVQYRYFALDSDHDISGNPLELTLDGVTYAATVPVPAPPAAQALTVPTGLTRYWWRALLGPGQTLTPAAGRNIIRGRLTDTPEILHPSWVIHA